MEEGEMHNVVKLYHVSLYSLSLRLYNPKCSHQATAVAPWSFWLSFSALFKLCNIFFQIQVPELNTVFQEWSHHRLV